MSIKKLFYIKEIDYHTAMEIIVKKHYLHRKAPCSFAFGLIEKATDEIKGVVTYGTPSSAPLRKGICGEEEKNNVIELTRLWVDDSVPRNGESFLIGNTIKKIDKEIVVSFAEIEQGHIGYVYQATNWYYTGLSAKRSNWVVEGMDKHCQTIADKYTAKELSMIYGDKFKRVPRSRKHRYVYFNCSKKRKKELLSKLKYKIQPYPKKEGGILMDLQKIIDQENLELDSKRLRSFQREIKETFQKNFDENFEKFVAENELSEEQYEAIYKYNEFLKSNA